MAEYYDKLMDDPKDKIVDIRKWIRKHNPEANSILELACGTGEIVKPLAKKYEVWGLDQSKEMVEIAKKKVRKGNFFQADMRSFALDKKFDVVLCIFDSINHLHKASDWKKVFKKADEHLNKNGLFIFDVYVLENIFKPWSLSEQHSKKIGKSFIFEEMQKLGKNKVLSKMRIFEHKRDNLYRLHEENILEVSFPREKILRMLKKHFKVLAISDPDRDRPTNRSEVLYFVCKKATAK